jgi:hypothetical protein
MENAKHLKPVQKRSAAFPEARDPEGVENIEKV